MTVDSPSAGSKRLGQVQTGHGEVEIWRLPNGVPGVSALAAAYVAVVADPVTSYQGQRVAMIVTVYDPEVNPERATELRETHGRRTPGRWYGDTRQIGDVFAYDEFRGGAVDGLTAAGAVGRFLFEEGNFELHSETRSLSGDRWAEAVGGDIPPLVERPTGDLATHMSKVLDVLNDGFSAAEVT
jgi:hypothetical protein